MASRVACMIVGLAAIAAARGDEPAAPNNAGRVVEGRVLAAGRTPVKGAKVFLGPADGGMRFVEEATAITDNEGRYRADLARFAWSTRPVRALVLAPGFKVADRTFEVGPDVVTINFEMDQQTWKETLVRVEDPAGKPVAGVEVTCSVGAAVWSRLRSDADGQCRIAMAPGIGIGLTATPTGARRVDTYLGATANEPASITVPVLPPIRGRVVDTEGRPVREVAVGRGIFQGPRAEYRMVPFPGLTDIVTDSRGEFTFAPGLYSRWPHDITASRPARLLLACFADASFSRVAFRVFDPTKVVEPMDVTLGPSRRVRVPIHRGEVSAPPHAVLSASILITPRPDIPDVHLSLIGRNVVPSDESGRAVLEEFLPEGTYQLEVNLTDPVADVAGTAPFGKATRALVVPHGEGPLELAPLELESPLRREMIGKPAPEIVATDLDTGKPVALAEFRGKVVVLDFWGYWCGVCNVGMPRLMDLHAKYQGRPLAIIALHDQSVQSRAEYDRKLATTRARLWNGRNLPFRVVLDQPDPKKPDDVLAEGNGLTFARYGGSVASTLFVIDAGGTIAAVVPTWNHELLESLVEEQVKKAEQREAR